MHEKRTQQCKQQRQLWKQMISILLAVTLVVTSLYLPVEAAAVEEISEGITVTEDVIDDAFGIGESGDEDLEAAETAEEELSGLEVDGIPVEQVATDEVQEQETVPEALILSEVEEEREEDSKTFLMSDGTFLVAQYGETIHYEDVDGNWEEVDNSVTEAGTGTEEGYETTEKAGKRDRIKFSKKLKEGKTVSIKNTDFPISWGFVGAEKKTVQILEKYEAVDAVGDTEALEEQETEASQIEAVDPEVTAELAASSAETEREKNKKHNDSFLKFDDSSEVLVYEDIYENVDATYEVKSTGIKENLILKAPGTKTTFDIAYDIGNLEVVQVDDQTIDLMNGDELIYQIQAPYMKDNTGDYSDKLTLMITEQKNKKLTVSVSADKEWLLSEERVYPVVLDPVVLTKTAKSAIDTTFIASGKASTNFSEKLELLVGKESSSYANCRTLIKFNLPNLNPGDMVVDADLNMAMYAIEFYADTTPDLQANVHALTENWSLSTVTWNNQPDFQDTVLDYNYLGRNETNPWQVFDITEAVKGWYEGTLTNNGVLVKSYNESLSYAEAGVKAYFAPERYNANEDSYPYIQITYRNNKGLEDYWTYTALSAGTAGTAYINDYTGNLVFVHDDVMTTGNLLPVTIQHVYNGYMMNQKFAESYPSAGRGWKLSIQQTVRTSDNYGLTGESLEDFPYAYEDGDGTVHFFYKTEEDGKVKYLDEDGLGLELTFSGNDKLITDEDDNVMTFGPKGNLTSIADAYGNTIQVKYTTTDDGTNRITKVIDGAGHTITLAEHNTNTHNIKSITGPAGRVTSFAFSVYNETSGNKSVTQITYPDGTKSRYSYDEEGALITATSADGSGLRFTYTSKKRGKRISKVEEFGADGTTGQIITFDRSQYNTTLLQTGGSDDEFGTNDDLITTCQFDNFGRTISAYTKTKSGTHYSGEVATYTSGIVNESGSNIKQLNKVSSSTYASKNITNLIRNHSAEKTTNWSKSYWNISGASYTAELTDTDALFGSKSFKVTGTAIPAGSGGMYYQDLPSDSETPGKTYTLSSFVKTLDVTQANEGEAYGACLAVRFTFEEGDPQRSYSEYITKTTAASVNNGWERISLTYTIPTGATNVRVCLLLRNATGTAYFDGVQLEAGKSMNPYNMLENASFDRLNSSGVPENWTISGGDSNDGYSTLHYFNNGGAMKLVGNGGDSKYVYQQVPVDGVENDIYVVSGWAKAEAVPDSAEESRPFDIYAMIYYSNGESVLKSKTAEFNRDVDGWQRVSMAFNLTDSTPNNNLTPTKISIGVRYSKQENVAYFDNIQLLKDVSNSYTYDKEGNIITARESGEQSQAMAYDDASNLTSLTDAENNLYEYEYNSKHQVTEAKSPMGQKVLFTYNSNSNGLHTATTISNSAKTMQIKYGKTSSIEEDGIAKGAYYATESDAHGNQTSYSYDVQKGTLEAVTTPDGTVTEYTYDKDNDFLTSVKSGDSEVTYEYDSTKTKLNRISHNGFVYEFTYDEYGNAETTKAAGNLLVTTEYAGNNGKLSKMTYGNEDTVIYEYDDAGNVSSISKNGTKTASWKYDFSGLLLEENALEAGRKTKFEYDNTGRLLRTVTSDLNVTLSDNDAKLYESMYAYTKLNKVKKELVTAGGKQLVTSYTYNENQQPLKVTMPGGETSENTYDGLGRITGKNLSADADMTQKYVYWSSERNAEGESLYKTTQVAREAMGDFGYYYKYDDMGNIILINRGTRTGDTNVLTAYTAQAGYEYDSKGQLVRENNADLEKTIVYHYDDGGNLTSKDYYPYTTADAITGQPDQTITYTYNSTWKDLLLSYNGEDITYDEIGNPLEYRGADLDWQGRELKSFTKDGTTISYTYGTDGIRTKKVVGNEIHEYYYSSGLLAYEKRGNLQFYYTYDHEGNLCRIRYINASGQNKYYYPAVNIRGDVQAIFDETGALEAEYVYDAWGNTIKIRDANGTEITSQSNIGHLNRIRYRGYYYDAETGFYYVSSRYYDPEVGRFLNADGYISTGTGILGFNMFAYCNNNPVNYADSTGTCTTNARGDRIPYKCTSKCIYDYRSIRNKQNYAAKGKGAVQMVLDIGTNATIRMVEIAPKPNNIGKGIHSKNVQMRIDNINSFSKMTQYTFDAFDALIIGHEIYINAMDNYVNNQGSVKIVWDGAVDAGVLITNACLTTAVTASAGAINPFLGITMGAGAGFALDTSGEYARREMKSWVK